MGYYIFMKNYGHTICVKTKDWNSKIKDVLEWSRGNYDVDMIIKNPESIDFTDNWMLESKEEFLEELEVNRASYWWDESEEEIEANIEFIESILSE